MDVLKRLYDSDKIRPTVEDGVTILEQLQSDALGAATDRTRTQIDKPFFNQDLERT
jgi:hypothetical protein